MAFSKEQNKEWLSKNTKGFYLRFSNETGIPNALTKAEETTGMKPVEYMRLVVIRALVNDNFLDHEPPADLRRLPKKKQDN